MSIFLKAAQNVVVHGPEFGVTQAWIVLCSLHFSVTFFLFCASTLYTVSFISTLFACSVFSASVTCFTIYPLFCIFPSLLFSHYKVSALSFLFPQTISPSQFSFSPSYFAFSQNIISPSPLSPLPSLLFSYPIHSLHSLIKAEKSDNVCHR